MKCTFYRPERINTAEWNAIRKKLREDLNEMETGKLSKQEVVLYLQTLLSQAEALEKNPAMRFLGYDIERTDGYLSAGVAEAVKAYHQDREHMCGYR